MYLKREIVDGRCPSFDSSPLSLRATSTSIFDSEFPASTSLTNNQYHCLLVEILATYIGSPLSIWIEPFVTEHCLQRMYTSITWCNATVARFQKRVETTSIADDQPSLNFLAVLTISTAKISCLVQPGQIEAASNSFKWGKTVPGLSQATWFQKLSSSALASMLSQMIHLLLTRNEQSSTFKPCDLNMVTIDNRLAII